VAIWQHCKRALGIFSQRMRRNSHGNSGQKSDPAIRSGNLDFLYDRCISTTEWRLLDIFDVFVLLRRMTLWPWPFDLECFVYSASHVRPTNQFYYPTTIGYWVMRTEYLITFPLSETVTAHAPCHVTSNQGQNSPHFLNPWDPDPNLSLSRRYDEE